MDLLTRSLLTGAAVCALTAAPAVAAVHMLGSNQNALVLHTGSVHSKTSYGVKAHPFTTYVNVTSTSHPVYTGKESTMYKKKVHIGNGGWLTYTAGKTTCHSIPGQKGKLSKDANAKIKAKLVQTFVSDKKTTGALVCKGTVSQFAIDYELKNKSATTDSFTFTATRKKWTTTGGGHYNLTANYDWTVNID